MEAWIQNEMNFMNDNTTHISGVPVERIKESANRNLQYQLALSGYVLK